MPRLKGADKTDHKRAALWKFGLNGIKTVGTDGIGNDVDPPARRGMLLQDVRQLPGHRRDDGGRAKCAHGDFLRCAAIDERARGRVFFNQRRVDFENALEVALACKLHSTAAPERIPFVDEIKGALL